MRAELHAAKALAAQHRDAAKAVSLSSSLPEHCAFASPRWLAAISSLEFCLRSVDGNVVGLQGVLYSLLVDESCTL